MFSQIPRHRSIPCADVEALDLDMEDASRSTPCFSSLPPEIIFCVLHFISRRELLIQIAPVSKLWYDLAHHKQLWWHHTFINNPYYFENKKLAPNHMAAFATMSNPFSASSIAMCRLSSSAAMTPTTPTTPSTPKSPLPPVVLVNPKAQLYSYKHYYYNLKHLSSKKIPNDCPLTLLNCMNYYFEHALVRRFTSSTGSSSNEDNGSSTTTSMSSSTLSHHHHGASSSSATGSQEQSSPSLFQSVVASLLKSTLALNSSPLLSSVTSASSHALPKVLFDRDELLEKKLTGMATGNASVQATPTANVTTTTSTPSLPPKRYRHTITSVPRTNGLTQLVLIGGIRTTAHQQSPEVAEDEVFILDCHANLKPSLSTPFHFKPVKVQGKPPHLGKHTAISCGSEMNPKIIIFGGVENETVTNYVYIFDMLSNQWTKIHFDKHDTQPEPRTNHQAALVGKEMYIVGGGVGNKMTPTNQVWAFHLETFKWRLVTCHNHEVFTPRLGFVMTQLNHKLLIYGGGYWQQNSQFDRFWKEKYTDLFILDTETNTFLKIDTVGSHPLTGTFPAHALVGTHWYIIGGAYDNEISNEIYCLDTVTLQWKKVDMKFYGGDSLAASHFVHQNSHKILILGGYCYHPLGQADVLKLTYMDVLQDRKMLPTLVQQRKKT